MANLLKQARNALKETSKSIDKTWDKAGDSLRQATDWAGDLVEDTGDWIGDSISDGIENFKDKGLRAITGEDLLNAGKVALGAALATAGFPAYGTVLILDSLGYMDPDAPGGRATADVLNPVLKELGITEIGFSQSTGDDGSTYNVPYVVTENGQVIGASPTDVSNALHRSDAEPETLESILSEQAGTAGLLQGGLLSEVDALTGGLASDLNSAVNANPNDPAHAIGDALSGGVLSDLELITQAAQGDKAARDAILNNLGNYLTGGLVTPGEGLYNILDDDPSNDGAGWQQLVSGLGQIAHEGWDPVTSVDELATDASNYLNQGIIDDIYDQTTGGNVSQTRPEDAPEFEGSSKVLGLSEGQISQLAEVYPKAAAAIYAWEFLPDSVKPSLQGVVDWIEDTATSSPAGDGWLDSIGQALSNGWDSAAAELPSLQPVVDAIEEGAEYVQEEYAQPAGEYIEDLVAQALAQAQESAEALARAASRVGEAIVEGTQAAAEWTEEEVVDPVLDAIQNVELPSYEVTPYEAALNAQLVEMESGARDAIDWEALMPQAPQGELPTEELDLILPETPTIPLPEFTPEGLGESGVDEGPSTDMGAPTPEEPSSPGVLDEAVLSAVLGDAWNRWNEQIPGDVLEARTRASRLLSGEDDSWQQDARYQSAKARASRLDDALGFSGSNTAMNNQLALAHDALINSHLEALWKGYGDEYWSDAAMAKRRYDAVLDAARAAGFYIS